MLEMKVEKILGRILFSFHGLSNTFRVVLLITWRN